MIPLRSRSDSFTFTPELSAIASGSNFSRCPPVFSLILAVSLLSESINPFQLVGMNLIFTAIWLVSRQAPSSESVRPDSNVPGGVDVSSSQSSLQQPIDRAMAA